MARFTSLITLAGLACAFAAGCGEDAPVPSVAAAKPKPPAKVDLTPFLAQAGEVPGFKPIDAPVTETSTAPFAVDDKGTELLKRSGYVSMVIQRLDGGERGAGVGNVVLFKTEAGALSWWKYDTSTEAILRQVPNTEIERFVVDGVPHSRGWIGTDLHGNPIGHVFWVQGRCMFLIGTEGDVPFAKTLSKGARAMHARTEGVCPA